MSRLRILSLALSLTLCVVALAALLFVMGKPTRAQESTRHVATTGDDIGDCTDPNNPCRTVQYAVDAADEEDVIKVAGGTYTDVQVRQISPGYENPPASGVITQVAYISRSVTIRGGYTADFTDPPDPEINPVILDARGLGRGLVISGSITVTVEGLQITGGDASGLGGGVSLDGDAGGGVLVYTAMVTVSHCAINSNVASTAAPGQGGGLYLAHGIATLSGNAFTSNTSSKADWGRAGGLYLDYSAVMLSNNIVQDNTASTASWGQGGGLFIGHSTVILTGNKVISNTASTISIGSGGGLECWQSAATLNGDTVQGNVASGAPDAYPGRTDDALGLRQIAATFCGEIVIMGEGGGLSFIASTTTISNSTIISNIASTRTGGAGGGMSVSSSTATLSGNVIRGNIASTDSGRYSGGVGGGVELYYSTATLTGNTVQRNVAGTASIGDGGGLEITSSNATLSNNIVKGNTASNVDCGIGGGLLLGNGEASLSQNTVIDNSASLNPSAAGYGGGLGIWPSSSLTLTNNLVSSNQANTEGSGLWFEGESAGPTSGRLLHSTIADNKDGCGEGVHVSEYVTLSLANTIISGHTTTGVFVDSGGTADLKATLWYDNGADTGGTGIITIGTINVHGDPAFMHPDFGNYHIAENSAAKDAGVNAGVTTDIDGQLRPYGGGYDIGADEFHPYSYIYLPAVMRNFASCIAAGDLVSWYGGDRCCAGLSEIALTQPCDPPGVGGCNEDGCFPIPPCACSVCSPCGDGVCQSEYGENSCSCPADCN